MTTHFTTGILLSNFDPNLNPKLNPKHNPNISPNPKEQIRRVSLASHHEKKHTWSFKASEVVSQDNCV